jgi:hypothetical protein
VRDGVLVAAAEEERLRRVKHWAGFPFQAIEYCLREAKLAIGDVDHIAINQDNRANRLRKLAYVLTRTPSISLLRERMRNRLNRDSVSTLFSRKFRASAFAPRFTTSSITSPICRRLSMFRPSRKPAWSRLMALEISLAPRGAWGRAPGSPSRGAFISLIP